MKKTLIALAALAATGAFAQSSVTISGNLDAGAKFVSAPTSANSGAGPTNGSSQAIAGSNTSTNAIVFKGTEDLGGGMKANFVLEMNPSLVQSSSAANAQASAVYTGTPFNGEQFLGLSGNFGEVKLGTPNSGFFVVSGMAQPFGTALGGGFSSGWGRLGTVGYGVNQTIQGQLASNRIIRHEKTIQYTSPTMSGFKAMVEYAAGNDYSATATSNSETWKNLAVTYSNGPLNIGYSWANVAVGAYSVDIPYTGALALATTSLPANSSITYNMLSANYAFGATTVYGGYTTTKHNAGDNQVTVEDASSWNLAAKYALSANTNLMANFVQRNTNLYGVGGARVYGLGADYLLSKRTNLYARYENIDNNTGGLATAGGSVTNTTAVGVRHQF